MMTNGVKRFLDLVIAIPAEGMEEWYVKDLIELGLKNIEDNRSKLTVDDIILHMNDYKQKEKVKDIIYRVGETLSIKMNNLYSLVLDVDKDNGYISKCYLFSPIDGNGLSE